MAKTVSKAKDTANKVVETAENNIQRATTLLRKGTLAYFGMYGAAYEQAQTRFKQARQNSDELFETFVKKGEEMEAQAGDFFKGTQSKVTETYEENAKKVRSILPISANDRVEELEAEIKALNKKIVAMGKQARSTAKTAKKTATEKTVKAATTAKDAVKATAKDVTKDSKAA